MINFTIWLGQYECVTMTDRYNNGVHARRINYKPGWKHKGIIDFNEDGSVKYSFDVKKDKILISDD